MRQVKTETMGKGVKLSKNMQNIILNLRNEGKSIREIANIVEISKNTVQKFLKNTEAYNKTIKRGRPSTVSERTKRQIKNLAVNTATSSRDIKAKLSLKITPRRIQQILSSDNNIKYEKMIRKPMLLQRHKTARLLFAEKYKFWTSEWENVIFSDQKKFNLHGPDGKMMYWRDIRRERKSCYARNFGGGSLMVWAAFGHHGRSPVCFVSTRMNSQMYISLMDEVLIPFSETFWQEKLIFQQDNAAIHVSKASKQFFEDRKIDLLGWPACSPDLNPIENVWGILSNKVYSNGRQFENVAEIKKAIIEEWTKIEEQTLKNLVISMPKRLAEVISNHGGSTHY